MNSKIKRIIDFSTAFGPSGMEDEVSKLAMEDVKDICEVHDDTMRNTYMRIKQDKEHETTIGRTAAGSRGPARSRPCRW